MKRMHLLTCRGKFRPKGDRDNWERHQPPVVGVMDCIRSTCPQDMRIVSTSATANAPFRHWLTRRSGWIDGPRSMAWLDFSRLESAQPSDHIRQGRGLMRDGVIHRCLIVNDVAALRNLVLSNVATESNSEAEVPDNPQDTVVGVKSNLETGIPIHADAPLLESIRITFANATCRLALAFIPSTASVPRVVAALRLNNVPAWPLYELSKLGATQRPALLVATEAESRGLDLAGLSHVFITFVPTSITSYLHMAGRVGRLWRWWTAQ